MPRSGTALAGRRILLTRDPDQAAPFVACLHALGAEACAVPLHGCVPPTDPGPLLACLGYLGRYACVAFASANAVRFACAAGPAPGRWPPAVAIGPATAAACTAAGLQVAATATRNDGAGLAATVRDLLAGMGSWGPVLVPRAVEARPELPALLRAAGCTVDDPVAYETRDLMPAPDRIAGPWDAVVVASPSAVRRWLAIAGGSTAPLIAIGPTTAAAAAALGRPAAATAASPEPAAVARAVATLLGPHFQV